MESISVQKFIPGGQTIGQFQDGRKIFFWGALPGEIVTNYQITKHKSHFDEAIALNIDHPSSHRINPADTHYLSTSPWQILDYSYELDVKRELLLEQFRQAGIILEKIPAIVTDHHDLFYRNKMEYSLYYDHRDQQIHPAFHARGSHRKIPITHSSIERPEIWQKATEIINQLNLTHADARAYQSLLLRCDQNGRVSGGLFENHQPHPTFPQLTDTILSQQYSYSPNGFFQINLPVYELALKAIAPHVNTDQVLDLYAGVGTIGLSVASDKALTLVECDQSAYSELEKNCRAITEAASTQSTVSSQVTRPAPRSILAKSEDALTFITPDQTVILDPPRAGCHPKLLAKLLEIKPRSIIYLSCNPATQARDAKILSTAYRFTDIQAFNFFPRTPHLESLLVLEVKPS